MGNGVLLMTTPDTTICKYCGKTITSQFINRMYCNATCCRLFLFFIKAVKTPNQKIKRFETSNAIFRNYLILMVEIRKEPLLQYKQWEIYLRTNPMPDIIKSLIIKFEPLPRELEPNGIKAK